MLVVENSWLISLFSTNVKMMLKQIIRLSWAIAGHSGQQVIVNVVFGGHMDYKSQEGTWCTLQSTLKGYSEIL